MKKIIQYISSGVAKLAEKNKGVKAAENIEIYKSDEIESENITNINKIADDNKKYGAIDFFKFWIIGLIVAYLGFVAYGVIDTIYLMILGYILSVAIESYILWMVNKGINRGLAILLSYLGLIGIILAGILIIVPFLAGQISDIVEIFLKYFTSIQGYISQMGVVGYINSLDVPEYIKFYVKEFARDPQYIDTLQGMLLGSIDGIVKQGSSYVGNAGILVLGTVKNFASAIFQITLTFTAAVLFSIDQENILSYINKVTDSRTISLKIKKIYTKIGYWLKSQLLLCLFIFITVYVGLLILEIFGVSVPNKLSLALISGLTEIIPYIGPFIGAVPGILVGSISEGLVGFLTLTGMYFMIQWIENNIFIPALMNKTLGVSPVLMFICMLFLGMIMGITGVIMAIPISIIISVMSE